ncbi:tetratricopeptide repeat protein [Chitinophagaceae bacterium MMS25-I14]
MRLYKLLLIILLPNFLFAQKQGQALTDSLLQVLPTAADDTQKVKILDQLSFDYSDVDPDLGIKYGTQSLQLAQKTVWKKGIARANADLGINYAAKSQYAAAMDYYEQALAGSKEMADKSSMAGNMVNIGNLYLSQTNYARALEYFFQGLNIYEELGDKNNTAATFVNIGIIYLEQKNYDRALGYYSKALAIYTRSGNQKGEALTRGNMGIVYDAHGNYTDALEAHWKALAINQSLGNKNGMQLNLANIGYVYSHMKDYPQALQYLNEALKTSEELGSQASTAVNLGNIGETYFAMSGATHNTDSSARQLNSEGLANLRKAIPYLEKAVKLCGEINFFGPLIEFNQYRSDAYLLTGDAGKAYNILVENNRIKDSVFSSERQMQIANMESAKEIMLKNKDLELKNKQLLIYKLDNARKHNQYLLYIFSTVFLLLASGIAIKMLYKSRHSNRILSREKAETVNLLRTSEANIKTVFDNTDTAYVFADENLKIISFNKPAQENALKVLQANLLKGINILDCIRPERRTIVAQHLEDVLNGQSIQYDLMAGTPDNIQWFFVRYFPVRDEHKKIHGLVVEINNITSRKQAEQQTLQLVNSLQKKNRDLRQFAYIISHNLRAPIAKIMGLAGILNHEENDADENKALVNHIAEEVHHIDDVITDLNAIISVRDTEETVREPINIEDKLKLVTNVLQQQIQESNAVIETSLEVKNIPAIKGYLYSILYNLLSNAIKYRNPAVQPHISISTKEENNEIRLTVSDNGLGIDLDKNREKLFGLYRRFHGNEIPGKGMGLYLVKTQVEALEGRLEVDSRVNQGTTFTIYLPQTLTIV